MTAEEYRNYLETDFDDVDLKEMKDIRKIRIDRNKTKEKRIAQYLRQVGKRLISKRLTEIVCQSTRI